MKLPVVSLPAALSPERIATLLDAEKAALWRAKFIAWWDGKDFDAEAFAQARAQAAAEAQVLGAKPSGKGVKAAPKTPAVDEKDLFEAPLEPDPPRVEALGRVWGKGRCHPIADGEESDWVTRLGISADAPLAVIGPGGPALVKALARAHAGPMTVFEWRDEITPGLRAQAARIDHGEAISVRGFELDSFLPAPNAFDAIISFDELSHCSRPLRFCQQIAKALRPGGAVVFEAYCRRGATELRTAFASAFAEPAIQESEVLIDVLFEAGLQLEANDDVTAEHLRHVRNGFKRLSAMIEAAPGMAPEIAREIAWEAEAWRERVSLLNRRDLVRRRLVAMKPLS